MLAPVGVDEGDAVFDAGLDDVTVKLPALHHLARVVDERDAGEDVGPQQLRCELIVGPLVHIRSIGTRAPELNWDESRGDVLSA